MEVTHLSVQPETDWPFNTTTARIDNLHDTTTNFTTPGSVPPVAVYSPALVTRVLLTLLVGLACIIGISCNSLVLLVILLTKSTRSISSCFLINLVSSDLILCATAFPAILGDLVMGWTRETKHMPDGVPCQLVGVLVSVFMYNSVTSLAAISLDRYGNIVQCMQYQYSRLYHFGGLLFCWFYSIGWSLGPILGWGSVTYTDSRFLCTINPAKGSLSYSILHCFSQFVLPLTIMSYCYVKIVSIAYNHSRRIFDANLQENQRSQTKQQHKRQIQQQQVSVKEPPFVVIENFKKLSLFPEYIIIPKKKIALQRSVPGRVRSPQRFCAPVEQHSSESIGSAVSYSSSQRETRAMVKLLGLICVFVITWLPLHINNLIYFINKENVNAVLDSLTFILACANSCLNPVLFGLASDQFRDNIKRRLWPNYKHRVKHEQNVGDIVQEMQPVGPVKVQENLQHPNHHNLRIQDGVSSAEVSLHHQRQTAAVVHASGSTLEKDIKITSWISHRQPQTVPSITCKLKEKRKKTELGRTQEKRTRKRKVVKPLEFPDEISKGLPQLLQRQAPLPPISSI